MQRYLLFRKVPHILITKRVIRVLNHSRLPTLALLLLRLPLRLLLPQATPDGCQRTSASLLSQLVSLVLRAVPGGPGAWQLKAPGRNPILHLLRVLLHHAI